MPAAPIQRRRKLILLNAKTKDALLPSLFLLGAWLIIGISIGLIQPAWLNQDTYQYLSIANYYLETPGWHIRDVHTVGPVIPALLAIVKWGVLHVVAWTPDVDVAIVKAGALACYFVITLAAVVYHERRGVTAQATAFVAALLLFTLPVHSDTASLNGELVCATWLALIFVVASKPAPSRFDDAIIVLLALLVAFTKLHALLLLAATFCTLLTGQRQFRIIVAFVALFCVTDLWLFDHGVGWLANLTQLGGYVRDGHGTVAYPMGSLRWLYGSLATPLVNVSWMLTTTFDFFPVGASAVVAALALRLRVEQRQSLLLWLLVYAASVIIPGRAFDHYVLCLIPVIFLFGDLVFRAADLRRPGAAALVVLVALAAIRFCSLVPGAAAITPDRLFHVIPRLSLTPEAKTLRDHYGIAPGDTLFVHGWDYRFYSYFDKGSSGPELAFVDLGSLDPRVYISQLLEAKPTFIFDIVNHSGLLRNPGLALAARPMWKKPIEREYDQVFSANGLVIYRRRDAAPNPPAPPAANL